MAPDAAAQVQPTQANLQKEGIQENAKIEPKLDEVTCSVNVKGDATLLINSINDGIHYHWLANQSSTMPSLPQSSPRNG